MMAEWQQDLYKNVSLEEFYRNVKNHRDKGASDK